MNHPLEYYITYSQNTLGTNQLEQLVSRSTGSVTLSVGLEVSKIANVTLGIIRGTVRLSEWVD